MTYYSDLINDGKRVTSFKKVIQKESHGIVYDLGTGSGILAQFASENAKEVYAIEQNPFIIGHTRKNLSKYDNIELIVTDAVSYKFPKEADVIICEMLDTALIDEEQVLVINNAHRYVRDDTIFIPKSVYTTMELISTNINHITYYEDNFPEYISLSDEVEYHDVSFLQPVDELVVREVSLKVKNEGKLNAIKLTTYTVLSDDLILEPTPMLNPPILVPVDNIAVKEDDEVILNIKYTMGGGLNTIQTSIRRNS